MIPLMKVHMPPKKELMPHLENTLYSGMVTEGKKVTEFESALKQLFNFQAQPLTTNSGTMALQLAYRCADIRGKYVLATPMTCTATNMPVLAEGGKLIWCDIDKDTGNISVNDVEKQILKYGSDYISAISFVDFAGYPADLDGLNILSKKYNIPLIEDSAQSLGAKWNGTYIGNHCDYVAFSFQAIKHLTTCDGGCLINNTNTWNLSKRIKWFGINREAVKEATRWHYDIPDWGYKGHMNNVSATIGLIQLNYIESIVKKHKKNGKWFDNNLQNIPGLTQLKVLPQADPSYWIYMVKVQDRDNFAKKMLEAGIGVNVAHIRNDQYSCFNMVENATKNRLGLEEFNNQYIAIPCGWWVTDKEREYIVNTIKAGW